MREKLRVSRWHCEHFNIRHSVRLLRWSFEHIPLLAAALLLLHNSAQLQFYPLLPLPFLAWKCDVSFPFQMIARINASKGKGERLFPYLLKIPDAGPPEKSRGMCTPPPTLADITHKEKNGSSRKIFRKLREPRKIHSPFSPGEREIPFPFVLPPTFKLPQGWQGSKKLRETHEGREHWRGGKIAEGTFSNFRADGKRSYRVKCFCRSSRKWM